MWIDGELLKIVFNIPENVKVEIAQKTIKKYSEEYIDDIFDLEFGDGYYDKISWIDGANRILKECHVEELVNEAKHLVGYIKRESTIVHNLNEDEIKFIVGPMEYLLSKLEIND